MTSVTDQVQLFSKTFGTGTVLNSKSPYVLGSAVPAGSVLENETFDPTDNVRALLTTLPTLGTLYFNVDGSGVYYGSPDSFDYEFFIDGVSQGSATAYFVEGEVVYCTRDALVLTEHKAGVSVAVTANAGRDRLIINEHKALVSLDINVVSSRERLLITEFPATVQMAVASAIAANAIKTERYKMNDPVVLLGRLPTGGAVTITLYDLTTGLAVPLNTNVCTEIGATGLYTWAASNLTTQPLSYTIYSFTMTDGANNADGKVVYSGYTRSSLDEFRSIQ